MSKQELSESAERLLYYLYLWNGHATFSYIMRELQYPPYGTTSLLLELVSEGLVFVEEGSETKRSFITLTQKGRVRARHSFNGKRPAKKDWRMWKGWLGRASHTPEPVVGVDHTNSQQVSR